MNDKTGITLVEYKVSLLQAAFLEYMRLHPYITFEKLKIHEGVPLEAQVATGFGIETVRFDKMAREEGLLR